MTIDLYKRPYPSVSDTRGRVDRSHKADAGLVLHLITGLVEAIEGGSLDAAFGFSTKPSPAYGRFVGLNLTPSNFSDVRAGFNTALNENGLTVQPPRLAPNSANKRYLAARSMGVSPEAAERVQPATPRSVRRFDEFSALMVGEPNLQAALDAGTSDGIPAGLVEVTSALLGALMAAVRAGDTASMRLIGEDFGSLAAALFEATSRGTTQRSSGGHVLRRKDDGRVRVTGIEFGDEYAPVREVSVDADGRLMRKRVRKG